MNGDDNSMLVKNLQKSIFAKLASKIQDMNEEINQSYFDIEFSNND